METIRAKQIAEEAHKDQKGKNGEPYIAHVSRVVRNVSYILAPNSPASIELDVEGYVTLLRDTMVVAWLHDVIEDQAERYDNYEFWSELNVAQREALKLMTKSKGQSYVDYIDALKYNDVARRVKLADLDDNTDPERQHLLDEATVERLNKKYLPAKVKLNEIERARI
jgi:predicted RecB family nuclease